MSVQEAIAKAREIAAKLSAGGSLGEKRKFDGTESFGLGIMKKKKVYIPLREHPDINFLGLLIGPRGATQKQLQEMSGAKIVIRGKGSQKEGTLTPAHPDDNDDLHVSIEGSEESIEKAYREISQILFDPESATRLRTEQLKNLSTYSTDYSGSGDYQVELRVPNQMVGLIIGKGGETLHRMQSQTGAVMTIAKESDMKPGETHRSIVLRGSPEAVADLKSRIDEVINSRSNVLGLSLGLKNGAKESDFSVVIRYPVPNDKVGIIIGKGGLTLKNIQEKTRSSILIPPGPDEDNPSVRTLSICADNKECAEQAHREVHLALQQQAQQALTGNAAPMLIMIPDDKVGIVIGKKGLTIRDIQARLDVRLQIPQGPDPGSNPPVRTCSLLGSLESQQAARYEIELILQGQGHLIGAQTAGATLPYGALSSATPLGTAAVPPYGALSGMMGMGMGMMGMGGMGMGMPGMGMGMGMYGGYYPGTDPYGQTPSPSAIPSPTSSGSTISSPPSSSSSSSTSSSSSSSEAPTDPTAFYSDYWRYATYYGEAAARLYYGAWSPPVGTPPPPGTVVAPDPSSSTDSTSGTTSQPSSNPTPTTDTAPTPSVSSSEEGSGNPSETSSSSPSSSYDTSSSSSTSNSSSSSSSSSSTSNSSSSSSSPSSSSSQAEDDDDPAAKEQWEAYQTQYREWWLAFGKDAGAPEEPPEPSE